MVIQTIKPNAIVNTVARMKGVASGKKYAPVKARDGVIDSAVVETIFVPELYILYSF